MKITNAAGLQRLFFLVEARSKHPNADVFQPEDILYSVCHVREILPVEMENLGMVMILGYYSRSEMLK